MPKQFESKLSTTCAPVCAKNIDNASNSTATQPFIDHCFFVVSGACVVTFMMQIQPQNSQWGPIEYDFLQQSIEQAVCFIAEALIACLGADRGD